MTARVVVLGAGYGGAATVAELQSRSMDIDLTWISEAPFHFVRHESHRVIRDPAAASVLRVPVEDIATDETRFIQGTVTAVDAERRAVTLEDDERIPYDVLVYALGSQPADYGIPGIAIHALTLNGLDDALNIHDAVVEAGEAAVDGQRASIVVGGGGLSGVQVAGEIAELRDASGYSIDVRLIEARERILPEEDPALSRTVTERLTDKGIEVITGRPISRVTGESVELDGSDSHQAQVTVWTGGITGPMVVADGGLDSVSGRLRTTSTLRTTDNRVFALGDAAVIESSGRPVPPTAQAAWQAAEVVVDNVRRTIEGRPLIDFEFRSKGTLLSVGDTAIARGVTLSPVRTLTGLPATILKKAVAARWIASITSWSNARAAWPFL